MTKVTLSLVSMLAIVSMLFMACENPASSTTTTASAPSAPVVTVPAAPAAPTLSIIDVAGKVTMHITRPSVSGATSYKVFYGTATAPTTPGTSFTATTFDVDIDAAAIGTAYYVRLKASNTLDSGFGTEVSVTKALPDVPAGLALVASNGQLTASWTTVSGATAYEVYTSTTSGSGFAKYGADIAQSATPNVAITGLSNGTTYYVQVLAKNSIGSSALCTEVSATPVFPAPAKPAVTAGNTQVSVTWSAVSGASSYAVLYDTDADIAGATTASASETGTAYTITGLTNGTIYYVFVRATIGVDTSDSVASDTVTPVAPAVPTINFDALTAGTQINVADATWSIKNANGTTMFADVSSAQSHGAGKSLRLFDNGTSKPMAWKDFTAGTANSGSITLWAYVSSANTKAAYIHIGNGDATANRYLEVTMTGSTGKLFTRDAGNSLQTERSAYIADAWNKIMINWTTTGDTYNVFLNDVQIVTNANTAQSSAIAPPTKMVLYVGDNASTNQTVYFDDIATTLY